MKLLCIKFYNTLNDIEVWARLSDVLLKEFNLEMLLYDVYVTKLGFRKDLNVRFNIKLLHLISGKHYYHINISELN
jgi:hypothetical protein